MTTHLDWQPDPEFSFWRLRWAAKIGFCKYLFNQGKEYAELFRGSLTPTLIAGFVTHQGGASVQTSFATALLVPVAFIVVGLGAGLGVWRWRIAHRTIEHEWENNPVTKKQIELLMEMRDALVELHKIVRAEHEATPKEVEVEP